MNVIHRNNVTVTGKGQKPMLFAHGYGCDQQMWRFITPAFAQDYKIVLFDHVGFGHADASGYSKERYATLQAYADDMLEICAALELRDVIFVGHSVSTMIGVLAAVREPDRFSKLILVSPSPRYINEGDYIGGFSQADIERLLQTLDSDYLGWAHSLAPVIMGNPERPELSLELTQSFCRSNEEVARDFGRITFLSDNRGDVAQVTIPTLILQCSEDVIAPLPVGQFLHRQMPGSQLRILEATGHCPNLSAPEETIAAMKSFLETG
jgi:sigma-B regulation protein RsbQ